MPIAKSINSKRSPDAILREFLANTITIPERSKQFILGNEEQKSAVDLDEYLDIHHNLTEPTSIRSQAENEKAYGDPLIHEKIKALIDLIETHRAEQLTDRQFATILAPLIGSAMKPIISNLENSVFYSKSVIRQNPYLPIHDNEEASELRKAAILAIELCDAMRVRVSDDVRAFFIPLQHLDNGQSL
jgi:hypothetical protein